MINKFVFNKENVLKLNIYFNLYSFNNKRKERASKNKTEILSKKKSEFKMNL